jgi:hypothetical protein
MGGYETILRGDFQPRMKLIAMRPYSGFPAGYALD